MATIIVNMLQPGSGFDSVNFVLPTRQEAFFVERRFLIGLGKQAVCKTALRPAGVLQKSQGDAVSNEKNARLDRRVF
jgi:hypothetical protein